MRYRLYISPVDIPPYAEWDKRPSYGRPEEVSLRHNWAVTLPNFAAAYKAGANAVEVINAEIKPLRLIEMEKVTIFIQYKKEFGIIRPIVEHLLPERLTWVLCSRSKEAKDLLREAGHGKSTILLAPDCSGEQLRDMIESFHQEPLPVVRSIESVIESRR